MNLLVSLFGSVRCFLAFCPNQQLVLVRQRLVSYSLNGRDSLSLCERGAGCSGYRFLLAMQGYLDWEAYADGVLPVGSTSTTDGHADSDTAWLPSDATVLLAADVVYDVAAIGALAGTVHRFLSENPTERCAVFATTVRNRATFDLFEQALQDRGIRREYENTDHIPNIFPVYHLHSRTGIRLCRMTIDTTT